MQTGHMGLSIMGRSRHLDSTFNTNRVGRPERLVTRTTGPSHLIGVTRKFWTCSEIVICTRSPSGGVHDLQLTLGQLALKQERLRRVMVPCMGLSQRRGSFAASAETDVCFGQGGQVLPQIPRQRSSCNTRWWTHCMMTANSAEFTPRASDGERAARARRPDPL